MTVVGGGVSGLATCFFLGQGGIQCVLVEKLPRLGGLIRTDHIDGCDLEAGPDSFIAAKTSVAALAQELGIASQIIGSNDEARKIFIAHKQHLVAMPRGMVMMTPGNLGAALTSPVFSLQTKFRFIAERWRKPQERTSDLTVGDFVEDHFGPDILGSITEPLLSGVYGGDAGRLSAQSVLPTFMEYERKYGSLIKGVAANRKPENSGGLFRSFAGGMQTLTDALVEAIRPRVEIVRSEAKGLRREKGGWRTETADGEIKSEHVVLASPAHVSSELLSTTAPELAERLAGIPYSSAILVTLVFDRAQLQHPLNGFGFLIPDKERKYIAAATWISTKFPSRTPENRAALRAFIVGGQALQLAGASDADLIQLVRSEFRQWMGITTDPLFNTLHRWPRSMPQYVVGHSATYEEITRNLDELPGLHLCGNAYTGVGIPDCIRMARQVAERIKVNQTGAE